MSEVASRPACVDRARGRTAEQGDSWDGVMVARYDNFSGRWGWGWGETAGVECVSDDVSSLPAVYPMTRTTVYNLYRGDGRILYP